MEQACGFGGGDCGGSGSGNSIPGGGNSDGGNSEGGGSDQPGNIDEDVESEINCDSSSVMPSGIFICNLNEFSTLVVLPPNVDPVAERSVFLQNLGWGLSFIAALSDVAELVTIATPLPGDEDFAAAYDLAFSIGSCISLGECRVSSIDPSLPDMAIINQEVILAGADLAIGLGSSIFQAIPEPVTGYILSNGPDAITTTLDLVHGAWKNNPFDIQENMMYLGVSVDSNNFVHVYVILNLEE